MFMQLSDELIARYVEGKTTLEERREVRRYLCLHPEEMENILFLMDDDANDYLGEWSKEAEKSSTEIDVSFSDISLSAAAFAPKQNMNQPSDVDRIEAMQGSRFVQSRLKQMLREINNH